MIRTLWVAAASSVLTVYYGSRIITRAFLSPDDVECKCETLSRAWAGGIVRVSGVNVHVSGLENLALDRPHVIVSNHESWFDVLTLVGALPTGTRFVAKKELETIPFFGRSWQACGHISIDRQDRSAARGSLQAAARLVRERSSNIVMFAEGTRSATGELKPFKKGAFVLAIEAGVPILPVAVTGSRHVMPKGSFRIRSGRVDIHLGAPIGVEGLTLADRDELRDRTWRAVAGLKGEPPDRLESSSRE